MFSFLKQRRFFFHLVLMGLISIGLIWFTVFLINQFTRHGESISVPDFSGLYYEELSENPDFERFEFTIVDSIYEPSKERGSILNQSPAAGAHVKKGRMVYLTIVAVNPKMVAMPELKDLSLRIASSLLQTYDLKVGRLSYEPDIAKNAVLKQLYQGKIIEPGQMIRAGSTIDLVLGLGERSELMPVPFLIGLTRSQAITKLHEYSLNIGSESFDPGDDTAVVKIYRQSPNFTNRAIVKFGSNIDLWYKSDKNFDFDNYIKTLNVDSILADTIF